VTALPGQRRTLGRIQLMQPVTVSAGSQLSGLFLVTGEVASVTAADGPVM